MGCPPELGFTCCTCVEAGWYPTGCLKEHPELMEVMTLLVSHHWWWIAVFIAPQFGDKAWAPFDHNRLVGVAPETPSFETFQRNVVIQLLKLHPVDIASFPMLG